MNYDSRRQIFVESGNDVEIYEVIYQQVKDKLINQEISLCFIPSGQRTDAGGIGNGCRQVEHIVNSLLKNGAKNVFGIIDRDLSNIESKSIKILGMGERYSIENYILDPLVMAIYLWNKDIIDILKEDSSETVGTTISDIKNFSQDDWQKIVNKYLEKFLDICNEKKGLDDAKSECEYINNMVILIPNWYLNFNGHDLLSEVMGLFPKIKVNGHQADPKKLVLDIVYLMKKYPEFIPRDFISLFNRISGYEFNKNFDVQFSDYSKAQLDHSVCTD
ncbi:MAG: hypothetical protein GY820_22275 [Gammaproteobacteria bacterium]|nr:hypothetical protein [Gammaproteobacteria bacterium]